MKIRFMLDHMKARRGKQDIHLDLPSGVLLDSLIRDECVSLDGWHVVGWRLSTVAITDAYFAAAIPERLAALGKLEKNICRVVDRYNLYGVYRRDDLALRLDALLRLKAEQVEDDFVEMKKRPAVMPVVLKPVAW